ncbi:RnfH family protein [Lysobacter sp. Root604]|uniref:RnfH family protein n=1 Tax=Lysobacter sp. Root604 TaxID=1736568 RepID=UPI0006F217C0|nr:RnfH family protein [Lysobacter sp. Root604]KRA20847.1 protein rnfH [Lysobacter sp. Root604]
MKIELVRAWPRRFETCALDLPEGARVRDALAAAGWARDEEAVAYAVYGVRVEHDAVLHEGDRVELLRPLLADPKDARRRRAQARGPLKGGVSK